MFKEPLGCTILSDGDGLRSLEDLRRETILQASVQFETTGKDFVAFLSDPIAVGQRGRDGGSRVLNVAGQRRANGITSGAGRGLRVGRYLHHHDHIAQRAREHAHKQSQIDGEQPSCREAYGTGVDLRQEELRLALHVAPPRRRRQQRRRRRPRALVARRRRPARRQRHRRPLHHIQRRVQGEIERSQRSQPGPTPLGQKTQFKKCGMANGREVLLRSGSKCSASQYEFTKQTLVQFWTLPYRAPLLPEVVQERSFRRGHSGKPQPQHSHNGGRTTQNNAQLHYDHRNHKRKEDIEEEIGTSIERTNKQPDISTVSLPTLALSYGAVVVRDAAAGAPAQALPPDGASAWDGTPLWVPALFSAAWSFTAPWGRVVAGARGARAACAAGVALAASAHAAAALLAAANSSVHSALVGVAAMLAGSGCCVALSPPDCLQ
ncbi:Protein of unknown function, partial [Gryllus bimaculatus]